MYQVGESSTLDITDAEFHTFMKVLEAMKRDGAALFSCAAQSLNQKEMPEAAKVSGENECALVREFNRIAGVCAAYFIRMKQRQAAVMEKK